MNFKLAPPALLLMMALTSGGVSAQTDIRAGGSLLIDNNIFRNYYGVSDVVSVPWAGLGYQGALNDDNLVYVGYNGQFYLFNELSERDFSVHGLSLDYNHLFSESRDVIAAGASFEARINPSDYRYYNYTSGGMYLNYKKYLRDDLLLLAGYNLNGRDFREFPEFNYLENVLALQASWFLPTLTTVQLSGAYYHKNYTSDIRSLDSTYVSPEQIEQETFQMPGRGRGMGRGIFSGTVGNNIPEEGFYWYSVRRQEFPSTDQFRLGLTVAQSLAEGTGLSFNYTGRINPHNRNRYLASLGENVLNNEELFDDHYSYNGHEARLQLRQMLPWQSSLTFASSWRRRGFSGRPAMDIDGNFISGSPSRLDRAILFEAGFTKSIDSDFNPVLGAMNFSLQAGTGKNRSNDAYYDHGSTYLIFGIEKTF